MVLAAIRTIFAEPDAAAVAGQFDEIANPFRAVVPDRGHDAHRREGGRDRLPYIRARSLTTGPDARTRYPSVFAGVRQRTNVAKRARVREIALYLVLKIVERLGQHRRLLNGGAMVMTLVLARARSGVGILVQEQLPRQHLR